MATRVLQSFFSIHHLKGWASTFPYLKLYLKQDAHDEQIEGTCYYEREVIQHLNINPVKPGDLVQSKHASYHINIYAN